eukprot:TCALIF_12175-PA protein Name:"Similar to ago F-box/WD repeat-containing protein 7 (Drosophila melanogaster)" AED:0.81 eAED:0.81 QI:0/0.5/0/1/0/0/3/0/413
MKGLGSWPRFVDVLLKENAHLKHLCQLNGWDRYAPSLSQRDDDESTKECEFIFQGLTDLAQKIRSYNDFLSSCDSSTKANDLRERYFTGGIASSMIVHNDLTICGMINGQIKIWDILSSDPVVRSKPMKVICAHNDSVVCMDGHKDVLASAARDCRFRLWDLDTGSPLRDIKCLDRLVNQISLNQKHVLCLYWFELDYMLLSQMDTKVVLWTVATWDKIDKTDEYLMAESETTAIQMCYLRDERVVFTDDQQHVSVLDVIEDKIQKTMVLDMGSKDIVAMKFFHNILCYRSLDKGIKCYDMLNRQHLPGKVEDNFIYSAWELNSFGLVIQTPTKVTVYLWQDLFFGDETNKPGSLMLFQEQGSRRKLVSIIALTPLHIISLAEEAQFFVTYDWPNFSPITLERTIDDEELSLC